MHRSFECSTTPSSVEKMQLTGQTDAQGASVQCMHAIETERSPGLPSLMVTTRRRLMPHGTSFSFLQAVTQALHFMQRSASQRNFTLAILCHPPGSDRRLCLDLTERHLGFLHECYGVIAVGGQGVDAFAQYDRVGALRIFASLIDALIPTREMEGHERDALANALGDERLHPR